MRVVVDTNVLISAIFFSGAPAQLLAAWQEGRLRLVASAEIVDEYTRVVDELARRYPRVDGAAALAVVVAHLDLVEPVELGEAVCDDPDDDKFLACALAARAKVVVSGDRHLLKVSGYRGVEVLRPRALLEALKAG